MNGLLACLSAGFDSICSNKKSPGSLVGNPGMQPSEDGSNVMIIVMLSP